jgi:hypothetical protein
MWNHAKLMFAIFAPIAATALLVGAVVQLAAPRASDTISLALLASGSAVVLLVWVKVVAVPLLTKGRLPDGRYLARVLMRQRILRQRARDRRLARLERRGGSTYAGPHAHRRLDRDGFGKDDKPAAP